MVVRVGNSPAGPSAAAAYDPRGNAWRRLPAGPLGIREGYVSVWTGSELLVLGGNRGDTVPALEGAALDPAAGTWRPLRAPRPLGRLTTTGAVWTGTRRSSPAEPKAAGPSSSPSTRGRTCSDG